MGNSDILLSNNNRPAVRRLAARSLKASKTRNLVAALAIALTALLFTALFTVAMSINDAFQESNFRTVGGYMHGGFQYLTQEQYDELKDDPLIREYGPHRFLGTAVDGCFAKSEVEVHSYGENVAQWAYLTPAVGRLPQEGTQEAAADLEVLRLLGVEPELGAEFTLTIQVGALETTQTFILCGWWEADSVALAHIVDIPSSRVDEVLEALGVEPEYSSLNGGAGSWQLELMLASPRHIEDDLNTILSNHGYQGSDPTQDNYISYGVNWGYTASQLNAGGDPTSTLIIAVILVFITLTGYLIIYNVFRISVAGDVRFYGLLKTVGMTGRQIKRLIRYQALCLCAAGIPAGLLLGWLTGAALVPAVLSILDDMPAQARSASPIIFTGAAAFSLATVLISCARPGRMAARVSPVEAVRYAEGGQPRRKKRKNRGGVSPLSMAWAGLGRSRGKTAVTVLSLALAVVLLCLTVTLAGGFDMDKYLQNRVVCDFMLAGSSYFHSTGYISPLAEDAVGAVTAQGGITGGGRMYFDNTAGEFIAEEDYRASYWGQLLAAIDPEGMEASIENSGRDGDGRIAAQIQLYGGEDFLLDQLTVIDGDISRLYEPGGRYIAAIYGVDDYGDPIDGTVWAQVGDTVTLRYIASCTDTATGQVYSPEEAEALDSGTEIEYNYRYVEYEVAALVILPDTLSARYYGSDRFILNAQTFLADTGSADILYYAFDTTAEADGAMEEFLAAYTTVLDPSLDYESRASYAAEFASLRSMFLLLGGVLSFVVGLVGVLNFLNAVITGITARRRELAMLQSVGMTGRQLKAMLMAEGLIYALGSALLALALAAALESAAAGMLESLFWFFSYKPRLMPAVLAAPVFAALGALLPLAACRVIAKRPIIERLRQE